MSWRALGLFLLVVSCKGGDETPAGTGAPHAEPSAAPSSLATTAAAEKAPAADKVLWIEAAHDADFASTVRMERAKAKRAGRTLVVYVGADWCPPCKAFHQDVLAGKLDATLGRTTFLVFDFDKDASRLGAFGYSTSYIPYFAKPGPDAKVEASFNVRTLDGPNAVKEARDQLIAWQK
jgi:thiol-disulfide isomerase/thioredoxin